MNNVWPPFYAPGGTLPGVAIMTSQAKISSVALLCIAAAALAGGGPAWAAGDPAQYEEVVRRETAGLDRSIAGIREKIDGLSAEPADRPEVQKRGADRRGQERFDSVAIRTAFLESEIERIEGLKVDLGSLDLAIALAPGTTDSVPSTKGVRFRVIIAPDTVAGFSYSATHGITIDLEPGGGSQTIHMGIPAGLPHRGGLDPSQGHLLVPVAPFSAMRDVDHALGECYTFVSVTVSNASSIYYNFRQADDHAAAVSPPYTNPDLDFPHPGSELYGKWLGAPRQPVPAAPPPVVGPAVPDGCGDVVIEAPFDPPLMQVHRDGILAEAVACNDGLVPHVRGEGALCLRQETIERLVALGVLEPEPEETLELARRLL